MWSFVVVSTGSEFVDDEVTDVGCVCVVGTVGVGDVSG